MTLEQLNELEAQANKAEMGMVNPSFNGDVALGVVADVGMHSRPIIRLCEDDQWYGDELLAYIAAANPATVKALVGAVKRLARDAAVLGYQQLRDPNSELSEPAQLKDIAKHLIQESLLEAEQ